MPKKFKVLLLSKHNVKYMRFLPFERILLLAWSAMSFRHARQPMVPVRSCINRVLQGDASSGLEILFQNLRLLLTLWILHKWRTEKGQWTLMTVVSCSWFFAELHALGMCWAEYRFRTHQSHDVENNETVVHHRRGPSGDAREKKRRGKSWGSLKCHTSPPLEKKVEAMYETSLLSVKVEPRSTSRLSSALFILPLQYFIYVIKFYVR